LEIFCIEFHRNQPRDMESMDILSLHPSELCDNYSAEFHETKPFTTLFVKKSQTSSQKWDKQFNQRQIYVAKSPNIRSRFCENM